MLQTSMRVAALVALSLLIVIPDALARGGGGGGGGRGGGGGHGFSGGGGRSFSGGHSYSGSRGYSASRSYSSPRSYSASRSYSAPRSYARSNSAPRSYAMSRSNSAPRQVATTRQHSAPQHVVRSNISTPRVATSHPVAQARASVAHPNIGRIPGRSFAAVQRNLVRPGTVGRTGFHLASAAGRTLGAHALHNKFVAGRLGVANVHSRNFAQAATFRGHFANRFWHRHHHFPKLIVLGWAGPLFWPYAYDDFVGYTFYPYAYDTFWPYAYDDVYDGIFGRYAYGNAPVRALASEPAPDGTVTGASHRDRAGHPHAYRRLQDRRGNEPDLVADRADRPGGRADRRAAHGARKPADGNRPGARRAQDGLPERPAEHADRTHRGHAEAARRDAPGGTHRAARDGGVLSGAERRAEGALQRHQPAGRRAAERARSQPGVQ